MSARLTLLLVYPETAPHSPLATAFQVADFRILSEGDIQAAKMLLSTTRVDAVLILADGFDSESLSGAPLKFVAPQTPVLLLASRRRYAARQLGVDSVCYADPHDPTVVRAVAVFLRSLLTNRPPNGPSASTEESARVRRQRAGQQLVI